MLTDKKFPPVNLKTGLQVDTKNEDHKPSFARTDTRMDWFESKDGIGSLHIRFEVSDFGTAEFKLFGSDVANGAGLFIDKVNNKIRFKNTNGTLTTEVVFNATLQASVPYVLDFVKVGETARALLYTVPLTISSQVASGLSRVTASDFTFGQESSNDAIFTAYETFCFQGIESDKKATAVYTSDIDAMCKEGNFIPARLHPFVVAHYSMQGTGGVYEYDCVEQYNYAMFGGLHNFGFTTFSTYPTHLYNANTGIFTAQGNTGNFEVTVSAKQFAPVAGVTYRLTFEIFSIEYSEPTAEGLLGFCIFGHYGLAVSAGTWQTTFTVGDGVDAAAVASVPFEFESKLWRGTFGNIKLTADGIEQDIKIKNNHIQLIGYSADETGATNGISSVRKDIITKQTSDIYQVDGSGDAVYTNGLRTEIASGLPELKGALNVTGKLLSYPSGTIILGFTNYNVLAYKLKAGQSLTEREILHLKANSLYANPSPSIAIKLQNYWQHNAIYDNAGTPSIKDLISTTHIPLTGYTADELNPAHANYAIKEINSLR